jgi:hypothetical protein
VREERKCIDWLAGYAELSVVSGIRASLTDSLAGRTFSGTSPARSTSADGQPAGQEFPSTVLTASLNKELKN